MRGDLTNQQYRGVTIVAHSSTDWRRYSLHSVVDGHAVPFRTALAEAKRLIDKALTSDRVTVDRGRMVFVSVDDYFAMWGLSPMPSGKQS